MPFDRFALMAEHYDFFLRKLSLGTELSPEDERTVEDIMRDADAAMYRAKILRAGTCFG